MVRGLRAVILVVFRLGVTSTLVDLGLRQLEYIASNGYQEEMGPRAAPGWLMTKLIDWMHVIRILMITATFLLSGFLTLLLCLLDIGEPYPNLGIPRVRVHNDIEARILDLARIYMSQSG